jgi:D-alanyl-D-alanine dipeptidase
LSVTGKRVALVHFALAILAATVISPAALYAQQPPREEGPFRAPELIELKKIDRTIRLDIRYATSNNFLGRPKRVVTMPSEYDEMTERSHINYQGGTEQSRRLRDMLRAAMEAEGFAVYEPEWWHYDYKDWKEYPILNISFSQIKR